MPWAFRWPWFVPNDWANSGADYSRYLPADSSRKGVIGWTTFAGVLTPLVLMLAGVLLSAGDPALAGAVAKDPFGAPKELERYTKQIGGAVTHIWIEGGGHDFKRHDEDVAQQISAWLRSIDGRASR